MLAAIILAAVMSLVDLKAMRHIWHFSRAEFLVTMVALLGVFYFNVEYVRDRLVEILRARPDPVRLVVFFLGTAPRIDLAGAELLSELQRTLRAHDIGFRLAGATGQVRDALRRSGFERGHGALEPGQRIEAVIGESLHSVPDRAGQPSQAPS